MLGLGGGSTIDSAKSIAVMAKNPGRYWDYILAGSGKGKTPTKGALPIVAIPTTAGTGTEADPWTVITKTDTNEKIGWGNALTFPKLSIVDPEMMVSVPPSRRPIRGWTPSSIPSSRIWPRATSRRATTWPWRRSA